MATTPTAIIVGMGELGAVFAHGLLKLGHPTYPVTRKQQVSEVISAVGEPEVVLVCVGEADLGRVLTEIPARFRDRVGLVQNELVPRDWLRAGLEQPSGVVVWFEKKAGRAIHIVLPSLVYGPKRALLLRVLKALSIPAREIGDEELAFELAFKNLYILVHNLAGIQHPGTVAELWAEHGVFARAVAEDVLTHQEALLGLRLDRHRLLEQLREAVAADPDHGCAGRTAPERLKRVLAQAHELGLELPSLSGIDRHMPLG